MLAVGQTEEELHDSQVALFGIKSEDSDHKVYLALRLCDEAVAVREGLRSIMTRAPTTGARRFQAPVDARGRHGWCEH